MTGAFTPRPLGIAHGPAICYSGYRENQSPATGVYPSSGEMVVLSPRGDGEPEVLGTIEIR